MKSTDEILTLMLAELEAIKLHLDANTEAIQGIQLALASWHSDNESRLQVQDQAIERIRERQGRLARRLDELADRKNSPPTPD